MRPRSSTSSRTDLGLIRTAHPERPSMDVALGRAVLSARRSVLRLYRPGRTVAFGRSDTILPGFPDAVRAVRAHGFTPVVRAPGGHAAAYHSQTLVLERFGVADDAIGTTHDRFREESALIAGALRSLGVDARIGAVPGEYCPGDYSVNVGGTVKLAGLAQRVVRGAFLIGAELVISDPDPIRAVLTDVYGALGLAFDPATAGAVQRPYADVEAALLAAYGDPAEVAPGEALLTAALRLERDGRVQDRL